MATRAVCRAVDDAHTSRLAGPAASTAVRNAGIVYVSDPGSATCRSGSAGTEGAAPSSETPCPPAPEMVDTVCGSVSRLSEGVKGYDCLVCARGRHVASDPSFSEPAEPLFAGDR